MNRLTMSRRCGGGGRGLGEDQGPVTQPLHAVRRLSAVGPSLQCLHSLTAGRKNIYITYKFQPADIPLLYKQTNRGHKFLHLMPQRCSFNPCIVLFVTYNVGDPGFTAYSKLL